MDTLKSDLKKTSLTEVANHKGGRGICLGSSEVQAPCLLIRMLSAADTENQAILTLNISI